MKKEIKTTVSLADVAGYEEEKEELRKIIKLLTDYKTYEEKGIYIPKGLILQGPPGCGKTLMVRAIASECNVPFFNFENNSGIDDVIKDLETVFKDAEKQKPAIVYIDELDKLVTNRQFASDKSRAVVQYLLTKLDSINSTTGIMVVASTNCYGDIPDSLLRSGRMDKKILIDYPDAKSRIEILKYYTSKNEIFKNLNIKNLAVKLQGMTGADIKTLVNNTLIEYVDTKAEITVDDFQKLINEMNFETIGKRWDNERILTKVLAHEVGHSLVGYFIDGNPGSITGIKYGATAGFTSFDEDEPVSVSEGAEDLDITDDDTNHTGKELLEAIRRCLGGMAAELVYYKEFDTGVASDLNIAENIFSSYIELGFAGLDKVPFYFRDDPQRDKNKRLKLRGKILKRELRKAKHIIRKNKALGYYLINEALENDDALSNKEILAAIEYYKANKAKVKKEFKHYRLENKNEKN